MASAAAGSSWAAALLLLLAAVVVFGIRFAAAAAATCPVDFSSYVGQFFPSSCHGLSAPSDSCCQSVFNAFGIGIAIYLRDSRSFEFPDNATATACLEAYQTSILGAGLGFPALRCPQLANSSMFIQSPDLCSGITTADDWVRLVGATAMDSSCAIDLSSAASCQICAVDVQSAINTASSISPNNSDCFYFTVLYAAAIINRFGPTYPSTAACLLASVAISSSSSSSSSSHRRAAIYAGAGAGAAFLAALLIGALAWLWCLRRRRLYHKNFVQKNKKLLNSSLHPNAGAIWYKFEEVKAATEGFAAANLIGNGGFASVYKGVMPDGGVVAVKRIKNCTPEGDAEFKNEVEVINRMRHKNLLALRGCCVASNTSLGHLRLLIYDYMPNGSLEEYMFGGGKAALRWQERRNIAIDTARGIAYLHGGVQPAIIHRDIKTSNVLLDEKLNAKVADFGLARVISAGGGGGDGAAAAEAHITTRVAGTQGYLAPEYALYGQVTEKSDVYSFGVLLLVLMSGAPALDVRRRPYPLITDWAWAMVKQGNVMVIVDESIRGDGPPELMERFVRIGVLCAHLLVAFRPSMDAALKMLQGDVDLPQDIPDRPLPLTMDRVFSVSADDDDEDDGGGGGGISAHAASFSSSATDHCSYRSADLLR